MTGKHYSQDEKKSIIKKVCITVAIVIGLCTAVTIVPELFDNKQVSSSQTNVVEQQEIVDIKGVKCTPKRNISTYLFAGTDTKGKVKAQTEYDGTGQCDVLLLLVIDRTAGTYKTLSINRDTMTDVKSLDQNGNVLATTKLQLSYAHANGDGMEMSCENTVDAVSNLLYGQKINGYAVFSMSAIEIINRLAGGVTVKIKDDFSKVDKSLKIGKTITLTDKQAMHYVHDRINVGDGTNECRMRRQAAYMTAIKPLLIQKCNENAEFSQNTYRDFSEYMVTDVDTGRFAKIVSDIIELKDGGEVTIEGKNAVGRFDYNEFTVDEDSLASAVLELFYNKINK